MLADSSAGVLRRIFLMFMLTCARKHPTRRRHSQGNTMQGSDTYENRWQDKTGTWFAPPGWKQACGYQVYFNKDKDQHLPMTPCVFDLSVDANETTNLAVSQPELLRELWLELNISWLGYYHSRTPAALLGTCNQECADKKWSAMAGGQPVAGPICGVPGCDQPPSPSPSPSPSPPGPPPFTPTNSTNCTYLANTGFHNRVPDHPKGVHAESEAECCRACYEDEYCVASAYHASDQSKVCYLHQSPTHEGHNAGVTGCVTNRPSP